MEEMLDPGADWRAVALRTGPADRESAEAGVRAAYRAAGLAEPQYVVWCASPLQATAAVLLFGRLPAELRDAAAEAGSRGIFTEAARLLEKHGVAQPLGAAGRSVREALRTAPWEAARRRRQAELGAAGWSAHWTLSGGGLWPRVRDLAQRIRGAVADRLVGPDEPGRPAGAARTAVRLALLGAVLGQHEAGWLAALAGAPELAPLEQVARTAGWWWPYENVVLLVERPVTLHQDESGRLHRADGPALSFPDGFALHAWRGMPVPADFAGRLADATPEQIRTEENAELRRVMLEYYGYDRFLADSGAEPVHKDETGVLWRIQLEGDEPLVMVEVVNSTPEPDGTHRVYWLRVPPHTRTAREGVAWTFSVPAEEYQPLQQT